MPGSCSECGSSRVVQDDLYSQRQWVCEDCGAVISEGYLTTTLSEEAQSTAVPYYASTAAVKKPCRNLKLGFCRVRALCRILRLSSNMESQAVDLFERAYNHPDFLYVTVSKKQILGGCCILHTCRQNNWPVSMGTVGYLLGADNSTIGTVYLELTKKLNIDATNASIMIMLESFCYDFKLGPDQVEEVFSEQPQRLVDRTSALMEVAAETWIVTGRQPWPLFMAAMYVAWQSLKPTARMKYSFVKFCKIAKAPEQWRRSRETTMKRLNELLEVLCKLGRELPWLRGQEVEPNTVVMLTDEILKNRNALLLRAVMHCEQQLQSELAETQTTQSTESSHEPTDPDPLTLTSSDPPPDDDDDDDDELPPNHWSKRHLFVPPCVKNQKRRRLDAPQLEVTGDEDISDGEIESYIRSEDEIKMYVQAQKELQAS